jgi:hypothetical protein
VWASTAVRRVEGRERLAAVELADLRTGQVGRVECDTLVFTGDWIPDHELARAAGAAIDPGTRGPSVDTCLETSVPCLFAAGNLVHAAETADVAAPGGVHAAEHIAAALHARQGTAAPQADAPPSAGGPPTQRVPITVEPPLAWIFPNAIRLPAPPLVRESFRPIAMGAAELAAGTSLTGMPEGEVTSQADALRLSRPSNCSWTPRSGRRPATSATADAAPIPRARYGRPFRRPASASAPTWPSWLQQNAARPAPMC